MTDLEYHDAKLRIRHRLTRLLLVDFSATFATEILEECIKILQPYAEKEREKTHA